MNNTGTVILLTLLGLILSVVLGVFIVMYVIVPVFRAIGCILRRIGLFFVGEVSDILRLVGAIVMAVVYVPLVAGSVLIGRWSAAGHYAGAMKSEFKVGGLCVYRMLIGHPLKLIGAGAVVQGLEERLPEVVAAAPTSDTPSKRTGLFEGYTIVGSMAGGGSGGKLYIAEPDPVKAASLERGGYLHVDQVVIKSFSLKDGSTLPQIVRESRALDAAKKLGLVLDHELNGERFYYVMRYVPGKPLTFVVQTLHAESEPAAVGAAGLDDKHLAVAMGYAADLLQTLSTYHRGGLWHKDVKPDNIIVDGTPGKQHAHLVDFGLVTPLRSAMTLTTHGTEYFRDPEMVRLALRGVKVQDVDGTKFDIFAAGAVLYAIMENSFPAHGALSQLSKRCPEAVRWIIRRAMTDYEKRYPTSAAMLADLDVVRRAADPFKVRPADLPSMRELSESDMIDPVAEPEMPPMPSYAAQANQQAARVAAAASVIPPAFGAAASVGAGVNAAGAAGAAGGVAGGKPRISLKNWWTGQFDVEQPAGAARSDQQQGEPRQRVARSSPFAGIPIGGFGVKPMGWRPRDPNGPRASAAEQLENARRRVDQARERATSRLSGRRIKREYSNAPRAAVPAVVACVIVAVFVFAANFNLHSGSTSVGGGSSTAMVTGGREFVISNDGLVATLDAPDMVSPIAASLPASVAPMAEWMNELPPEAQAEAQQKVLQTQAQLQQIIDKAQRELVEIQNRVGRSLPKSGTNEASEPSLGHDSLVSRVAGNRVILVNELRPPLAPEVAAALRNYSRRLERLGVMVVGEAPWREADGDEIELVASLRNACGQTPIDTAEFGEHLRGWLEERDPANEAWAILWVSAMADGKPQVRLIGPLDENGNPDAELRNMLLQRLSSDASPASAPMKRKGKPARRSGTPA